MTALETFASIKIGNLGIPGTVCSVSPSQLRLRSARTLVVGQRLRVRFQVAGEWFDLGGIVTEAHRNEGEPTYEVAVSAPPTYTLARLHGAIARHHEAHSPHLPEYQRANRASYLQLLSGS